MAISRSEQISNLSRQSALDFLKEPCAIPTNASQQSLPIMDSLSSSPLLRSQSSTMHRPSYSDGRTNSLFLSPPITSLDDLPPFRPSSDDHISLNMVEPSRQMKSRQNSGVEANKPHESVFSDTQSTKSTPLVVRKHVGSTPLMKSHISNRDLTHHRVAYSDGSWQVTRPTTSRSQSLVPAVDSRHETAVKSSIIDMTSTFRSHQARSNDGHTVKGLLPMKDKSMPSTITLRKATEKIIPPIGISMHGNSTDPVASSSIFATTFPQRSSAIGQGQQYLEFPSGPDSALTFSDVQAEFVRKEDQGIHKTPLSDSIILPKRRQSSTCIVSRKSVHEIIWEDQPNWDRESSSQVDEVGSTHAQAAAVCSTDSTVKRSRKTSTTIFEISSDPIDPNETEILSISIPGEASRKMFQWSWNPMKVKDRLPRSRKQKGLTCLSLKQTSRESSSRPVARAPVTMTFEGPRDLKGQTWDMPPSPKYQTRSRRESGQEPTSAVSLCLDLKS
ncbi:MAG: hypothetical protein M1834_003864 [Cirrosporium novae-zelandiae]|nr:MAG: hypothetical protein M1834_003864 [Cirrosporium novae-zelandiae]